MSPSQGVAGLFSIVVCGSAAGCLLPAAYITKGSVDAHGFVTAATRQCFRSLDGWCEQKMWVNTVAVDGNPPELHVRSYLTHCVTNEVVLAQKDGCMDTIAAIMYVPALWEFLAATFDLLAVSSCLRRQVGGLGTEPVCSRLASTERRKRRPRRRGLEPLFGRLCRRRSGRSRLPGVHTVSERGPRLSSRGSGARHSTELCIVRLLANLPAPLLVHQVVNGPVKRAVRERRTDLLVPISNFYSTMYDAYIAGRGESGSRSVPSLYRRHHALRRVSVVWSQSPSRRCGCRRHGLCPRPRSSFETPCATWRCPGRRTTFSQRACGRAFRPLASPARTTEPLPRCVMVSCVCVCRGVQ